MTARKFKPKESLEAGLCDQVYEASEIMAKALEFGE